MADRFVNPIDLAQVGGASSPPAGIQRIYAKVDGRVYTKAIDGVEKELSNVTPEPAITFYAPLTADVVLTTAGTLYQVLTVSLTAGTWFINANAVVRGSSTADSAPFSLRLWDGTTTYAQTTGATTAPGGGPGGAQFGCANGALSRVLTLTSTKLITLAAVGSSSDMRVLRFPVYLPEATGAATHLSAHQIL